MKQLNPSYFLILLLSLTSSLFAFEEYETVISPIPTILSGTTNPFVLSVDGKIFIKTKNAVGQLKIGGTNTKIEKKHSSFFFQIDTEDTVVSTANDEGKESATYTILTPKVRGIRALDEKLIALTITGTHDEVVFDRKPMRKTKSFYSIYVKPEQFFGMHTLEIKSKSGPGRTYNVEVTQKKKIVSVSPPAETLSSAETTDVKKTESHLVEWWSLRATALVTSQASDGLSLSGEAAWVPQYWILEKTAVRGSFGMLALKKRGGGFVPILDLAISAHQEFTKEVFGELGGGGQFWINYGGLHPSISGVLGYKFTAKPFLSFINEIFTRYQFLFSPNRTHQAEIGIAFHL